MITRAASAAATRRDLLDAARSLLDQGGPSAVTLREVGARAGVSRAAPYRHFADKSDLLLTLATEGWDQIGERLQQLGADRAADPLAALRAALAALIDLGRSRPHLYRLMFTVPAGDSGPLVRAAGRTQALFLDLVGRVVGPEDANPYAALLLTSAHGLTDLELSGHLLPAKWGVTTEDLVALTIGLLDRAAQSEQSAGDQDADGVPGQQDADDPDDPRGRSRSGLTVHPGIEPA